MRAKEGDLVHPRVPPLTRTDAYIAAALSESDGRRVDLQSLIHDFDWLNRAIPTFDQLSYGIPRLMANGYVDVYRNSRGGLRFAATGSARALRRSIDTDPPGMIVIEMPRLVGAAPWPEPEIEDRSLGRLPDLTATDVEVAYRKHERWVEHWSKPLVALSRVVMWWINRGVR
jgi:hypothetical protein